MKNVYSPTVQELSHMYLLTLPNVLWQFRRTRRSLLTKWCKFLNWTQICIVYWGRTHLCISDLCCTYLVYTEVYVVSGRISLGQSEFVYSSKSQECYVLYSDFPHVPRQEMVSASGQTACMDWGPNSHCPVSLMAEEWNGAIQIFAT